MLWLDTIITNIILVFLATLKVGTGKSTLVKFIIDALNINHDKVCYIAFTGKAASVLKQKGCPNAMTAHKLLYKAKPKADGSYIFIPKEKGEIGNYKVIVIDEVSMLPKKMWDLLISHGIYIIALGDPGQLPPIDKDEDNHILDHPHIFLDEIMRQAQESEIIRLSMFIREGKPLESYVQAQEQVRIHSKEEIVDGMYSWADQILCATNQQRIFINNFVRENKGYPQEPQIGDKIISLRNHWDEISMLGDWALINGAIGEIFSMNKKNIAVPIYISDKSIPVLYTSITLEDGDCFVNIPIDYTSLIKDSPFLTPKQSYLMMKNKNCPNPPYEFTYAYGITTHKAQGSEWDKVLVFEEKFPFSADEHKRWLYTACTRAKEKLVIVKK